MLENLWPIDLPYISSRGTIMKRACVKKNSQMTKMTLIVLYVKPQIITIATSGDDDRKRQPIYLQQDSETLEIRALAFSTTNSAPKMI